MNRDAVQNERGPRTSTIRKHLASLHAKDKSFTQTGLFNHSFPFTPKIADTSYPSKCFCSQKYTTEYKDLIHTETELKFEVAFKFQALSALLIRLESIYYQSKTLNLIIVFQIPNRKKNRKPNLKKSK